MFERQRQELSKMKQSAAGLGSSVFLRFMHIEVRVLSAHASALRGTNSLRSFDLSWGGPTFAAFL